MLSKFDNHRVSINLIVDHFFFAVVAAAFKIFNVRVNHIQKSRSQRSTDNNIVNLQINDAPGENQIIIKLSHFGDRKFTKNKNEILHHKLDQSQSDETSGETIFNIKLHKSKRLFDDSFVFITRDENRTSVVNDFDKLAEKYSNCFYRNENSAIDLCDGNMVCVSKAQQTSRLRIMYF